MVEMWPMLLTRPSSRLCMRCRELGNRLLGERSRVLRSSRVRVRGRLLLMASRPWSLLLLLLLLVMPPPPPPPPLLPPCVLARGTGGCWWPCWVGSGRALWCERGDCGGEAYRASDWGSSGSAGWSGVTARMERLWVLVVVPVEVVMEVVKVAYSKPSSRCGLAVVRLLSRLRRFAPLLERGS